MALERLDLPPLVPAPGVLLRTFRPGDEHHWARIMNECIGDDWTAGACRERLVDRPEFQADGCFFAEVDGTPQGTATAWRHPHLDARTGYVHMVGVARAARGRGLGRLVTLAVLHYMRSQGCRRAVLETDDWRIPAVITYLGLGFEPVPSDEEDRRRWAAVLEQCRTARQPVV